MAESKNSSRNSCKVFSMAVVLSEQPEFSLCNSRITASAVAYLHLPLQLVCCMAKTSQPHVKATTSCGLIWEALLSKCSEHKVMQAYVDRLQKYDCVPKFQPSNQYSATSMNCCIWTSIRFKSKCLILMIDNLIFCELLPLDCTALIARKSETLNSQKNSSMWQN